MQLTVIINTYPRPTRAKDLLQTLRSLYRQDDQRFDILIVENSSSDTEVHQILRRVKLSQHIKVITDTSKKLSTLFNSGWHTTQSSYIAYIADDAEADKQWLKNIKKELHNKQVGIITGPILSTCFPAGEMHRLYLSTQKNAITKLISWPFLYFIFEGNILKPGYLFQSGAYSIGSSLPLSLKEKRQEIDLPTTTSMGIKRSILKKLRGFDEQFSFNHADGDLFIRVKKLGYKIVFNPEVVAHHHVRLGPSRYPEMIGRDTALFLKKHLRPKSIQGIVGAILYVKVLNLIWIYYAIKLRDITKLKGITGFFSTLLKNN